MQITVNISDVRSSRDPADTIITYSLGSCIGVAVYEPTAKVAGLLHYQLPTSTLDAGRAKSNPNMFADTGFANLLAQVQALGAEKKKLKIVICGGANMLNDSTMFDIGKRNHTAIRKLLWQNGMFIEKEDCGGTRPRTVSIRVLDGMVTIKTTGEVKAA